MIEMQMGQQHIRNVIPVKAVRRQGFIQGVVAVQIIVAEEPGILLIADAVIHQDQFAAVLDQQQRRAQVQRLFSSGGWTLLHRLLGTTPNMAPPSNLKKPVGILYTCMGSDF